MKTEEIDLHRLELRYAAVRVQNGPMIRRLADSISKHGQLDPLYTVVGKGDNLILIDGYHRHSALQYLGRDTALIVTDNISEEQAIAQLLRHRSSRQRESIEEAGLIQELHHRFGFSLGKIGQQIGRDKSFVKRRLDLIESLPAPVLKQVIAGTISTWGASRVLVPLARANAEHATTLAEKLTEPPLSTRQLTLFYTHYQQANRHVKERMIGDPKLFIDSLQAVSDSKEIGPEEKWLRDAGAVCGILSRLYEQTDTVFYPNQEKTLRHRLLVRAAKTRRLALELRDKIKEHLR